MNEKEHQKKHPLRISWTHEEDEALIVIMKTQSFETWDSVARRIAIMSQKPIRDSCQVNQHWRRVIYPKIEQPDTVNEEYLMLLYALNGNQWSKIAEETDGMSDIQVKYRIEKLIKDGKIKSGEQK